MAVKTLVYNIKKDLKEHFSKEILYDNKEIKDFMGVLVKEVYEDNPKIEYPMITIEEFDNSANEQYTSNLGEEFSNLGYQINLLSRNLPSMQAPEAVRVMQEEVDKVLGVEYKMVRGTPTPVMPLPSDNTVKQLSIRYTCVFDLKENRIYRN